MVAVEAIALCEIEALIGDHPGVIAYALLEDSLGAVSAGITTGNHEFWSYMLQTAAKGGPTGVQSVEVAGVDLSVLLSAWANFIVLRRGPWTLSLAVKREAPLTAAIEGALDHFLPAIAAFEGLRPEVRSLEGC